MSDKSPTMDDIRRAVKEIEATMPRTPDFYIILPYEAMPDVKKAQLQRAQEHIYLSENIETEKKK